MHANCQLTLQNKMKVLRVTVKYQTPKSTQSEGNTQNTTNRGRGQPPETSRKKDEAREPATNLGSMIHDNHLTMCADTGEESLLISLTVSCLAQVQGHLKHKGRVLRHSLELAYY